MLRALGLAILASSLVYLANPRPAQADDTAELARHLEQGDAALVERLKQAPADDRARVQLGLLQFVRAFEHLGQNLHKYGLRTERSFVRPDPAVRELFPQNPTPEKISYADARRIVETFVKDLETAETTLAAVKDANVKVTLDVTQIKVDPFGQNRPVSFAGLAGMTSGENPPPLVLGFDRGDVNWLRGYMHFLMAWGDIVLAHDMQEIFDCTAHRIFERVDSPHAFLQEEDRRFDDLLSFRDHLWQDVIAFIHLWRFPLKDADRMASALKHFEAMSAQSREMWKHYQAETDNDHEWIPNPKQTGAIGIPVSQETVTEWLATLDEVDLVLKGQRLLPFWRGNQTDRGVNLKRVFTEPRGFDIVLWVQGTGATPYLEKGPLTSFTRPDRWLRMQRTFGGGDGFFRIALWFN